MMKKIIMLEKQVNEEWIKIWVKDKMIGSFGVWLNFEINPIKLGIN
jgi:hypothetical protein